MPFSLDSKDRLLLAWLRRNARMTAVELAARLQLSRSSVQARIARLERIGVIRGYTVVLGEEAPQEALRCWFVMKLDKDAAADLIDRIRQVPGVGAAYLLTGDVDVLVEVRSGSIAGVDAARLQIASLAGVADIRTHVVLRAASANDVAPDTQWSEAAGCAGD
jgi:DNA-binding Lrp family transcriptional regulator